MATPWMAAERGDIDAVIQPRETRLLLRKSLKLLRDKQKTDRVLRKQRNLPIYRPISGRSTRREATLRPKWMAGHATCIARKLSTTV
jgi:hypothetical protein